MSIDIQIENAHEVGDMIEGEVVVTVNEGVLNFSKRRSFRTDKNVEKEIADLGNGIKLIGKLTLEPPNQVCITGKVRKDIYSVDIPGRKYFSLG